MSLRKAVPPPTLEHLLVPDKRYQYFAHWPSHPFRQEAADYEPVNAWWLAEASLLVYADAAFIDETLARTGLAAAGFGAQFFERGGTQCCVLGTQDFAVAVFRGTQLDDFWAAAADVATDLQPLLVPDGAGGRVHKGVLEALGKVWVDVSGHLRGRVEAGVRAVWFAGHSLGGALATLAADRADRELGVDVGGLYTFGSPRVGDANFKARLAARGLEQKTFRVVHDADIVARVPPELHYEHVGRLRFIDAAAALQHLDGDGGPTLHERLLGDLRDAFRAAPFFASALRRLRLPIPKPLADHAPVYYPVHLWNSFNV